jgi:hypothetical protein
MGEADGCSWGGRPTKLLPEPSLETAATPFGSWTLIRISWSEEAETEVNKTEMVVRGAEGFRGDAAYSLRQFCVRVALKGGANGHAHRNLGT